MREVHVRSRHFNGGQLSGIGKYTQYFDYGMSLLRRGGGLMHGIKIPQCEFALKMQGGLMHEGGHICGTLRYFLDFD